MLEEFREEHDRFINPEKIWARIAIDFLKWTGILLLGAIILLVLSRYLPSFFFAPPVKLYGLLVGGWIIFCLIRLERTILPKIFSKKIFLSTLIGGVVVFCEQVIFQAILQFTYHGYSLIERIGIYGRNLLLMTVLGSIISFFIVFQMQTKKTGMLILMIIGFFIILGVLKEVYSL